MKVLTQANYLISAATVALSSAFGLGYYWGSTPHEVECAVEIIQGRELLISRDQCLEDLAGCKSSAAGGSVIKCEDSCDVRVQNALAEAAVWACGD